MARAQFFRNTGGTTATEFALLAAPFFLAFFVLFQTALIYVVQLSLSHESQRMARDIRTGKVTGSGMTEVQFRDSICDALFRLVDCDKIAIDLKTYSSFATLPKTVPIANGELDRSGFRFDVPSGGAIMMLRVFYELPIIGLTKESLETLNGGRHLVVATNVFKTEPF